METIHVVMQSSGSYDTYENVMVKGFTTPEKARAYIVLLEAGDKRFNELLPQVNKMVNEVRARPELKAPTTIFPERPKWVKGIKMKDQDPALKQAMKDYDKLHAELVKQASDQHADWMKRMMAAFKEEYTKMGLDTEVEWFGAIPWVVSERDFSYEIEKLQVD